MFIDVAKIELKAGKGGDGSVAFRREKYEPSGGPAGGDGGDGGSIIIVGDKDIKTLMDYSYRSIYKAESGGDGRNKKQFGKKGEDLILKVPVGTLVKDYDTDTVIYDVKHDKEEFVICKGGKGGKGNVHFKSSIRQAPRFAEPGEKGEEKTIKLELKLLADVGLIGLPNVGKSTLLSIMSNARPKIANYHFTTLEPNLGVCKVGEKSFVLADIPGLIEGASEGLGLGHDFLKHIERTKILVHVLDISGSEGRNPIEDFELINSELSSYNIKLNDKKMLVVLNKTDLGAEDNIKEFREKYSDKVDEIVEISAATTENVDKLMYLIADTLDSIEDDYSTLDEQYVYFEEEKEPDFKVRRENENYIVEGPLIENLIYRTNFEVYESVNHLQKVLEDKGVIQQLKDLGIQDGDNVVIGDVEFDFYE
ncbi:GTPase ObgE [Finegoldia magna]|uniref:GTPase Obg n=2 Tax=Finegoldia magna TaxID=1260 RepID=OBG_FINM2|nr:GTPase ObgE [Finegoldia magna]B0S3Z4.1 RecName: Full=GTPase Obg; AltName: Full=GTP-binding protein Obg [Finegoldia magna ATCC 29328]EFL53373.1 Obg family GTPase CgtA [Finegoldia magna BVS033A4]EXF27444.1 GTPase [Finegoldia magna ALB8]MDU1213909.1 GTPase ObgE [Finegoldia magna]MDU2383501.1 GTPase ObgE [Finegoldia magna]MDU5272957.1 GTPase ObgE [Finegoldia magna]